MKTAEDRIRDQKGRFSTKRKLIWKENLQIACKKRKLQGDGSKASIVDGRRVVEIDRLADEMWCRPCDAPLSFRYIEKESIVGFVSIFSVRCHTCLLLHRVRSSNCLKKHEGGNMQYDVNTKSALAMIDTGIGATRVKTFLSTLNVPVISSTLLKRNERHVGKILENLAQESCREALKLEKELTLAEKPSKNLEGSEEQISVVQLKASYDAGWQKTGSGRAYNSLTAHAIGIGSKSKRVIAYATRNKRCIMCEKGHSPEDHDCRLNHTGSSKSMEASIAVENFTKNPMLKEDEVAVTTIIGDDDSSTIAQLRRESEYPVEKETDKNHAICTLSKALWALKIPSKVIDYIKYCFGCALKKNRNNEEAVRTGLLNIVPHAFDDHSNCGEWCRYNKDPFRYSHKILPGGKGLTDENMKASLSAVLQKFAVNAKHHAPCGSTQGNESFQNISLSKTTKRNHYGGSESNDFRVASAICQQNCGTSYVVSANEKLALSPGKQTEKYRAQKDKMRKARALSAQTVEKKRRRRELHQFRHNKNTRAENKEDVTYSSGCGFNTVVELEEDRSNRDTPNLDNCAFAVFDLETTGLSKTSKIVQISAKLGFQEFNSFIVPSHDFSPNASLVTGFSVNDGELFRNGEKMKIKPRRLALKSFIEFLSPGPVILIAHNSERFDAPILLNELKAVRLLDDFRKVVVGFCDTLPLLKKNLPDRIKAKKSFSQSVLAEDLLGNGAADGAHDSIVDVKVFDKLIEAVGVTETELQTNTVTVHSIFMAQIAAARTKVNRQGLDCLKGGVSVGMLTKMATAGITIDHLKKSYTDGGADAVTMLLGEDINGRPRVTKTKKVLLRVIAEIKNLSS